MARKEFRNLGVLEFRGRQGKGTLEPRGCRVPGNCSKDLRNLGDLESKVLGKGRRKEGTSKPRGSGVSEEEGERLRRGGAKIGKELQNLWVPEFWRREGEGGRTSEPQGSGVLEKLKKR